MYVCICMIYSKVALMAENTYVIICPYDAYKLYITLVNLDTRLRFPTLIL